MELIQSREKLLERIVCRMEGLFLIKVNLRIAKGYLCETVQ